ncbi:MAG: transposase [Actinobacteria bacterium]|nr:transposase [Actinomycetota bacterium]
MAEPLSRGSIISHSRNLTVLRPGGQFLTGDDKLESVVERFGDECLNTNKFLSIEDARAKIAAWRIECNNFTPHSSLGNMTPAEYAANYDCKETPETKFSLVLNGPVFG